MNELQVFDYTGKQIRVVEKDGEPWFVLKDVCDVLGLTSTSRVSERLEEDERGVSSVHTPGGQQDVHIINESGLYNVILRSDKEEAKPFRKWVTSEVLPSIRKHGAYLTPAKIEEVLLNPDTIIQLATQLKTEQEQKKKLKEEGTEEGSEEDTESEEEEEEEEEEEDDDTDDEADRLCKA
jgi:prophage antirepressor-like protein